MLNLSNIYVSIFVGRCSYSVVRMDGISTNAALQNPTKLVTYSMLQRTITVSTNIIQQIGLQFYILVSVNSFGYALDGVQFKSGDIMGLFGSNVNDIVMYP